MFSFTANGIGRSLLAAAAVYKGWCGIFPTVKKPPRRFRPRASEKPRADVPRSFCLFCRDRLEVTVERGF
jgi:hypothetical protein